MSVGVEFTIFCRYTYQHENHQAKRTRATAQGFGPDQECPPRHPYGGGGERGVPRGGGTCRTGPVGVDQGATAPGGAGRVRGGGAAGGVPCQHQTNGGEKWQRLRRHQPLHRHINRRTGLFSVVHSSPNGSWRKGTALILSYA